MNEYEVVRSRPDTHFDGKLVCHRHGAVPIVKGNVERDKGRGFMLANSVARKQRPDLFIARLRSLDKDANPVRDCNALR